MGKINNDLFFWCGLGAKRCQCISGKTKVVEKTPLGLLSVVSDAGFSFLAKKRTVDPSLAISTLTMLTFYLSLFQRDLILWWWWSDSRSFFISLISWFCRWVQWRRARGDRCVFGHWDCWPCRPLQPKSKPIWATTMQIVMNAMMLTKAMAIFIHVFFSHSWHIYLSAPSILSSFECLTVYMLGSAWPYVCLCAAQINTHKQKVTCDLSYSREKCAHFVVLPIYFCCFLGIFLYPCDVTKLVIFFLKVLAKFWNHFTFSSNVATG